MQYFIEIEGLAVHQTAHQTAKVGFQFPIHVCN